VVEVKKKDHNGWPIAEKKGPEKQSHCNLENKKKKKNKMTRRNLEKGKNKGVAERKKS